MKIGKAVVFVAVSQAARTHSARTCRIVLALAGLAVAGCRSSQSQLSSSPRDDKWLIAAVGEHSDSTADPPAVLFVEYATTPPDVVDRMLGLAQVTKDDVVCDLGCGDGRILVAAAKRYGCRAVGYDLDPLRAAEARSNAEHSGVAHLVTIEQRDVLTVDLRGVSVVTIYLGTEINARLIPQLSRLKAGSRIVSHDFEIGDITPDKTVEMTSRSDRRRHRIYLWRCPFLQDRR